ncbi:MAG: hypothetical protein APF77_18350 [Clostridia bacterium BRH_c25]|nr:MAG: hypothetical protein APF77_18350 [Clostridia bacterium BRH_c25]
MLPQIYEKVEDGIFSLEALLVLTDNGIMLFVGGGEKPHIGTVVISQPRPSMKGGNGISCTTSVTNMLSHKDDLIIIPIAEAVCKKANTVVAASGGVHIDAAEEFDIKRLMDNMEEITKKLLARL